MRPEPPDVAEIELDLFLEAVKRRWDYDFTGYARASLRRRLSVRTQALSCSMAELQHRVLREPAMLRQIVDDLSVQASEMFRHPPTFVAFRQHVVPLLRTYPRSTIWQAGTGYGEEAWSYAILLEEEGLLDKVRIYCTDVNPRALKKASEGVFPLRRMKEFTKNYQASGGSESFSRYYEAGLGQAALKPELARSFVFSTHNLVTDDVFVRAEVISCRNVLIYFGAALKERVLGLFDRALNHQGVLCLGSAESLELTSIAEDFVQLDPSARIYRRRSALG